MPVLTVVALTAIIVAPTPAQEADGARCRIVSIAEPVVETRPFTVTVSYRVPAGGARLNCELKRPDNVVIDSDRVPVTGQGEKALTVTAPSTDETGTILVAVWLGVLAGRQL